MTFGRLARSTALVSIFCTFITNSAAAQENSNTDNPAPQEQTVTIPPEPQIIKKRPDAIPIPPEALSSVKKYEERTIASSNVVIGSNFGYRRDPFTRRSRFHSGLDIKARSGDRIGASLAGTVQFAGWYSGYGNWVVIDHGGGVTTHYAHLSGFAVSVGQRVERGTVVGYAGRTGRATSPHLHYELRVGGNPVNPLQSLALDSDSDYFKKSAEKKSDEPAEKPDGQSVIQTGPSSTSEPKKPGEHCKI